MYIFEFFEKFIVDYVSDVRSDRFLHVVITSFFCFLISFSVARSKTSIIELISGCSVLYLGYLEK